jgi:hypothetical protein
MKNPDHCVTLRVIAEKIPEPPEGPGIIGEMMPKTLEPEPAYGIKSVNIQVKDDRGLIQEMVLTEDQLTTLQTAFDKLVPYAPPPALDLGSIFGMRRRR